MVVVFNVSSGAWERHEDISSGDDIVYRTGDIPFGSVVVLETVFKYAKGRAYIICVYDHDAFVRDVV